MKQSLFSYIYYTKNSLTLKAFSFYKFKLRRNFESHLANFNHDGKILFIHNPKVAGNSILEFLGLKNEQYGTSHSTPTFLVPKNIWETYYSVVAIRNPIDRLVSSYFYHTKPEYKGVFNKQFPNLPKMTLEEYFETFKSVPYVIMPQHYYTRHFLSKKEVDFLLRFESLEKDLSLLADYLNIDFKGLPHLNASKRPQVSLFKSQSFKDKVLKYYSKDFELLDYSPNFERFE